MVKKVQAKKNTVKAAKAKSVKKTAVKAKPKAIKAVKVKKSAPKKKAAPVKKAANRPSIKTKKAPAKPVKKVIAAKKAAPKKKAAPPKKKAVIKKKAFKAKPKAIKAVKVKKAASSKKTAPAKKVEAIQAKKVTPIKKVAKEKIEKKEYTPPEKKEPLKVSIPGKGIKAILLKKREDLLKEILESRARESDPLKREIGDIYDEASSERERELSLLLGDRDRQKLIEIDDALQRIESGEYGICENCGDRIATGRLNAQPFTKLCINCKTEEERQEAKQKKFEAEGVYRNIAQTEEEEGQG